MGTEACPLDGLDLEVMEDLSKLGAGADPDSDLSVELDLVELDLAAAGAPYLEVVASARHPSVEVEAGKASGSACPTNARSSLRGITSGTRRSGTPPTI